MKYSLSAIKRLTDLLTMIKAKLSEKVINDLYINECGKSVVVCTSTRNLVRNVVRYE